MDFFNRLNEGLIQNGFIAGHTNSYIHPLSSFTKEEGATWHVVIIGNLDVIPFEGFIQANEQYTRLYSRLRGDRRPGTIFITNILITYDEKRQIRHFIENLPPFAPESINNIYWNLNLATGDIILNKNHPTEILNLRKIIDRAYKNDGETTVISLSNPIFTYLIMIFNVIMFMLVLSAGGITLPNLVRFGAMVPSLIMAGEYYRLLSAMFLHANIMHLGFNMLSLYIFGTRVERYYGKEAFALIYILSGITGGLFSLFFSPGAGVVTVGASGAIFGLIGAATIMAHFLKRDLGGLTFHTMLAFIALNFGISLTMDNVDNFGHLGGLVGGIILGMIICRVKKI